MFQCWLSGMCCHDLQVSAQELSEMILAGPILRPLHVEETGDGHTLVVTGTCPWLNEDKTCSIYEHRPGVCRGYLCFRGNPDEKFRDYAEQTKFMQEHPEALEQARQLKNNAMAYAKEHGWNHLS